MTRTTWRQQFAWPAASLCLWAACQAPRVQSAARVEGRPTLAEIFALPPAHGRPPALTELAADGSVGLMRWRALGRDPNGKLDYEGDVLWLIERDRPLERLSLRRLLAGSDTQEDAESGELLCAWSEQGHRLAVARLANVYLLDRQASGDWRAALLLSHEPPPAADPSAVASDRQLAKIVALTWKDGDREVWFDGSNERFALRIPAPDEEAATVTLDGARWLTEELSVPIRGLQWSEDRRTLFAVDGRFPAQPEESAEPPAAPGLRHVLKVDSGRSIELQGFDALVGRGREALAPDGRYVAAESVDRASAPEPNLVPDYLTTRVSTREARRDRADDPTLPASLHLWSTETGERVALELPDPATWSVHSIGWSPARERPATLAFARRSTDWKGYEVWVWTEAGAARLHVEHDPRWYGGPLSGARWSGDGRRLILGSESNAGSMTAGRAQLFAIDPWSGGLRQLTTVRGEVDDLALGADGSIVVSASQDEPAERELVYLNPALVRGEAGASFFSLAAPRGFQSRPRLSRQGTQVWFAHSELGRPLELWTTPVRESGEALQLTDSAPRAFVEFPWIRPVRFQAAGADGVRIHSHVFLPRESSLTRADRPRACVVFMHGAGYLQNVTASMTEYEPNLGFHSRLAEQGYVVVDVDYRGSAGYGHRFRTDVQGWLGALELADIHTILDALAERGVIDAGRVACYGGSYGGFLTLMALFTEPGRWKFGAALRSVTDWRSYAAGYIQPRLGRPSTNPEAYARSSPIDQAAMLQDPLLLLHGLVDENVFAQDTLRLMETLIDAGKDFEVMLYPSQGHAFDEAAHWIDEYRRIERSFHEHLGAP